MKAFTNEQLVLIRAAIQHRIDQMDHDGNRSGRDEEQEAEYTALKQLLVHARRQSAPCKQPARRVVRVSEPTTAVKSKNRYH